MPASLFSLYIRYMVLYPKTPENNKGERILLWLVKIVGVVAIGVGIYVLYGYISIVFTKHKPLGWSIFYIVKTINLVLLGIGFLVHYKKSMSMFSSSWIFASLNLALLFIILREWFFYRQAGLRMDSIALGVFGILFLISCWIYNRKKYPEEFGLKS